MYTDFVTISMNVFSLQDHIPEEWADILVNLYYPAVLSAFSLLVCFWAEVGEHVTIA